MTGGGGTVTGRGLATVVGRGITEGTAGSVGALSTSNVVPSEAPAPGGSGPGGPLVTLVEMVADAGRALSLLVAGAMTEPTASWDGGVGSGLGAVSVPGDSEASAGAVAASTESCFSGARGRPAPGALAVTPVLASAM